MRKLILLVVLFAISVLLYTGFWFYTAQYVKEAIENNMASIENLDVKSIAVSGFPLNFTYELESAVFEINSESDIFKDDSENVEKQVLPTKWRFNTRNSGKIIITSNLMATKFEMKLLGGYHYMVDMDGVVNNFTSTHNQQKSYVSMTLKEPLFMADGGYYNKATDLLGLISKTEQSFVDIVFKHDETGDVIFTSANHLLAFEMVEGERRRLSFLINDARYTPQADNLFKQYLGDEAAVTFNGLSESGNINMLIDVEVDEKLAAISMGDLEISELSQLNKINFDVHHFNYSDDFGSMELNMNVEAELIPSKKEKGDYKKVAVNFYQKFNVTEKLYEKATKQLNRSMSDAETMSAVMENIPLEFDFAQPSESGEREQKSLSFLPKIHEVGDIVFETDIEFLRDETNESYDVDMQKMNVMIGDYGIKLSGKSTFTDKLNDYSDAQLLINLINYKKMIDDGWGFFVKTYHTLDEMKRESGDGYEKRAIQYTDAQRDAIKKFLLQISDEPQNDASDLNITVKNVSDEQGAILIGTMPFVQVAMAYGFQIAPLFQALPLEGGYYHCKCKLAQCIIIDKQTSVISTYEKDEIHRNITSNVAESDYLSTPNSMLKTGWACKNVGVSPLSDEDEARMSSSPSSQTSAGGKPNSPNELSAEMYEQQAQRKFNQYFRDADQGDADAQYNLAILFAKGVGTEKDPAKALEWLRKSADQGHIKAKSVLNKLEAKRESSK